MKKILFAISVVAMICSCNNQPKPDYTKMSYEDIPYEEFIQLDESIQYKIKYPKDCDSIVTLNREIEEEVLDDNGQPYKSQQKTIYDTLYLGKDRIYMRLPEGALKATLSFSTIGDNTDKAYDKVSKEYTDYFVLPFKNDKSKGNNYVYINKADLPNLSNIWGFDNPINYIHVEYGRYSYYLTESEWIRKDTYGKDRPKEDEFDLQENEISKFLKYINYKPKDILQ